ncbi:MAG: BlaI/MecI/CopY family transcriptional regulator [Planctomycetota bacterium]|jgi:predicted transcriptional regulator
MAPLESDLGTAELEVLRTLWDEGPSTVRDVMNHLHDAGRKVAYTTVLTFLTRLEQKGYVRSDKSGLAYVYKPKVTREKVSSSRLKSLIRELYDGAAAPLILQLVREERLNADEIAELQELIDELDKPRPSRSRRKGRS